MLYMSVYSRIECDFLMLSGYVLIFFDFLIKCDEVYLEVVCLYVMYVFFFGSDLSESECVQFVEKVCGYGVRIVCLIRGEYGVVLLDGECVYY